MSAKQTKTIEKTASKWAPIKTGRGMITGYIEVFPTPAGKWVTIPGVSGFRAGGAR
jgi:hypothetical protein